MNKPLSIPTNWAEDFFEQVELSAIGEIYGKLPHDAVGGGRADVMFLSLPRRAAARHIAAVRRRGIRFNYLLNATCLDNREFNRAGRNRIRRLLDSLAETGGYCTAWAEKTIRVEGDRARRARFVELFRSLVAELNWALF